MLAKELLLLAMAVLVAAFAHAGKSTYASILLIIIFSNPNT
jgi:hypothetical protein